MLGSAQTAGSGDWRFVMAKECLESLECNKHGGSGAQRSGANKEPTMGTEKDRRDQQNTDHAVKSLSKFSTFAGMLYDFPGLVMSDIETVRLWVVIEFCPLNFQKTSVF